MNCTNKLAPEMVALNEMPVVPVEEPASEMPTLLVPSLEIVRSPHAATPFLNSEYSMNNTLKLAFGTEMIVTGEPVWASASVSD